MAGDWIKWQRGLARKPEVIRMAAKLGIDRHEVAGRLMEFWEWTDEQIADPDKNGHAFVRFESGHLSAFVNATCGLTGMFEAMVDEGWIVLVDSGAILPNWGRHNGKSAKRRCLDQDRKRLERESVRILSASEADKRPLLNVTREEKRRVLFDSSGVPSESNTSSEAEPAPSKAKSRKPAKPSAHADAFEQFWLAYPPIRRVMKSKAYAEFVLSVKRLSPLHGGDQQAAAWLVAKCQEFAASPLGGSQFVPQAPRWLAHARYDDDPSSWTIQTSESASERPTAHNGKSREIDVQGLLERSALPNERGNHQ